MRSYGLYSKQLACWAKSGGKVLRYWGIERATEKCAQWNNAGAQLGADWEVTALGA